MYKYIGTARIPNETQITNSTRKNEKFRYLHTSLYSKDISKKNIYIYTYICERTFYNAKIIFWKIGKLIRFLFIKVV